MHASVKNIDIDTEEGLNIAEAITEEQNKRGSGAK